MILISETFLQSETRCDFTIDETMKRVWATELTILAEIDRICKANRIPYHANYGTLLGAVRHGGFVPWDDDIDLSMKRADYLRFIELAKTELPSPMVIDSYYTYDDHFQPLASVSSRFTIDDGSEEAREITERYFGCPYIVGVDIYPLDYVAADPELADLQLNLYNAVYDLAQRYAELSQSGELYQYLPQIEELTGTTLPRDDSLRRQLWLLADRLAMLCTEEESDMVIWMPDRLVRPNDVRRPIAWYEDTIELPFEMTTVSAPREYDALLRQIYGDYQTINPSMRAHDYPFYKSQEIARQRLLENR